MVLQKGSDSQIELTAEFWRSLVRKIVAEEETLGDLVRATGIPREILRKWALKETAASQSYEPLVPARRVDELEREVEELRSLVSKQATTLQILEKQGVL